MKRKVSKKKGGKRALKRKSTRKVVKRKSAKKKSGRLVVKRKSAKMSSKKKSGRLVVKRKSGSKTSKKKVSKSKPRRKVVKKRTVPLKKKKIRKEKVLDLAKIRVVGVGGSGKNVTNHMIKSSVPGINFLVANTDLQDIEKSKADIKIRLGENLTKGLGTGMNADLGRSAAEEAIVKISESLKGSDLIFVACGMGGGTGTGASPVIAKTARNMGILTIGVVTSPFSFEGRRRSELAEVGIKELARNVDAILVIKNDKILQNSNKGTSMAKAFSMSDDVLLKAVRGISDLITMPGEINVDFADIKTVMQDSGTALMGVGKAKGQGRADVAVNDAISSPLLDVSMKGAKRVLFSVAAPSKNGVSMSEVQRIAEKITESVDENAKIIFGTSTDKSLSRGEVRVTVLATSFDDDEKERSGKVKELSMVNNSMANVEGVERIGDNDLNIDDEEEEEIDIDDEEEDDERDSGWKVKDIWKK